MSDKTTTIHLDRNCKIVPLGHFPKYIYFKEREFRIPACCEPLEVKTDDGEWVVFR